VNNMTKVLAVFIASAFIIGCFSTLAYGQRGSTCTSLTPSNDTNFVKSSPLDKNPEPKQSRSTATSSFLGHPYGLSLDSYKVGDKASFYLGDYGKWAHNDTNPTGFMPFTMRAEGNMSELWTCDDMTFFSGDSRNTMTSLLEITNQQAKEMVNQFDSVIYPTVTRFAGPAPPRDGENSIYKSAGLPYFPTNITGRVMIMVFNIWNPAFYYNYTDIPGLVGYYEPSTARDYDRNIVHLDNWDWINNTGPQSNQTGIPFLIEETLAHEYQHVINDYYNSVQASFLNEGCSELASVLCGYDPNYIHNNNYNVFLSMPDDSLIDWSGGFGQMTDYAAAGLFVIYLYDHFGDSFVHDTIATNLTGIAAINEAFVLNDYYNWDFNRVFNDWRLANLIHSNSPGNGLYNYKSINLNNADIGNVKTLEWSPSTNPKINSASRFFGTTKDPYGYDTGISKLPTYGTDYIHVNGMASIQGGGWSSGLNPDKLHLSFNGDASMSQGWQIVNEPSKLQGEAIFKEDFEHGESMPGWATTSFGTTLHPWYIQQASNGNHFVVANAYELGWDINPYPDMRESLYMTQGFSTIDYNDLGLEMTIDSQMMWAWGAFCRVLYSVDSGSTWFQLTNYTDGTSSNPIGSAPFQNHATVLLDLSDAAGYRDVRLAFDFSSYNIGYWFALDDIMVGSLVNEKMWWSGNGDMKDYNLTADLDLMQTNNPVLSFDSKWNIEDTWDFGFVQLSSDGGLTWTSLMNKYTTNEAGYGAWPESVANLPGITGDSPFVRFQQVSYDLSNWAGQIVKVRFRYITDWSTSLDGWYVDNIRLNGKLLDNADDLIIFKPAFPPKIIDWMVSIYLPGCTTNGIYYLPIVLNLRPQEITDTAIRYIGTFAAYHEMYIIISPTYGPSDYRLNMIQDGG